MIRGGSNFHHRLENYLSSPCNGILADQDLSLQKKVIGALALCAASWKYSDWHNTEPISIAKSDFEFDMKWFKYLFN